MSASKLLFSTFDVTRQAFYRTHLSFALVNLKPILPGHVLVIPNRVVPRLSDLSGDEISDLFQAAQKVGSIVEKQYGGQGLTVACQDGAAAGQSVPHVHIHIMPRRSEDFEGENDAVYPALEASERKLKGELIEKTASADAIVAKQPKPLKVDADEDRKPRSPEEMEQEAKWLATFFKES